MGWGEPGQASSALLLREGNRESKAPGAQLSASGQDLGLLCPCPHGTSVPRMGQNPGDVKGCFCDMERAVRAAGRGHPSRGKAWELVGLCDGNLTRIFPLAIFTHVAADCFLGRLTLSQALLDG